PNKNALARLVATFGSQEPRGAKWEPFGRMLHQGAALHLSQSAPHRLHEPVCRWEDDSPQCDARIAQSTRLATVLSATLVPRLPGYSRRLERFLPLPPHD